MSQGLLGIVLEDKPNQLLWKQLPLQDVQSQKQPQEFASLTRGITISPTEIKKEIKNSQNLILNLAARKIQSFIKKKQIKNKKGKPN